MEMEMEMKIKSHNHQELPPQKKVCTYLLITYYSGILIFF